jgi:protein-disulfide isomerase/uncharacterized membrane protein
MMKKVNLLLVTLVLDICAFVYLTVHHYAVKTGIAGDSICSISSKLNCDAAALSSYSEIFNIPVAVLGTVFHVILFFFILFYKLGWAESSPFLRNTIRFQLALAAFVSVVMGAISILIIHVTCPFCALTYLLSLINLGLGWNLVQASSKDRFDVQRYFTDYKSHLYALISVPVISWLAAGMIANNYQLDELKRYVPEKVAIWKAAPENHFDLTLGISNKVQNPKYTLVEYADFKCPHCRDASKTLNLFVNSHPDVLFVYKPFPLDGTCNPAVTQKGDGSRCAFAALAVCSDKLGGKGLEVTHWLFENQEKFYQITDGKTLLPQIQETFGLDPKALGDCADSAETYGLLTKSAQEGDHAGVEGTPTIYVNGKKLPWGHVPAVLSQVIQ